MYKRQTLHQLNDVLWAEVSKWQSKSPLLKEILQWTKTKISMIGSKERWYAVARTATTPENMQGFHEDNMLFIVDEASGVADPIMEAILGLSLIHIVLTTKRKSQQCQQEIYMSS